MRASRLIAALVAFLLFAPAAAHAQQASAADTAKFLAGMPVSADSPLAALTKDGGWQQHSAAMSKAFAVVEKSQLSAVRDWSKEHLKTPQKNVFYMFSGPDYLFADAFFPSATTYVLVGLEPVGQIPDPMKTRHAGLGHLQHSMRTLLAITFFITADMRENLGGSALRGTLPIMYVFLARTGKEVKDASLVYLDDASGDVLPEGKNSKSGAHGVKVVFTAPGDPRERTLYYFSSDLANDGVKRSGLLKFLDKLGTADSFHKSASYLMHRPQFSRIAEFIVSKSATVVQDDSGIPIRYFDQKKWDLRPFGRYHEPLGIFPEGHQPKIRELFAKGNPPKLTFGLGYRWRPGESNLLLAVNREAQPKPEAKAEEPPKTQEKPPEKAEDKK